MPPLSVGLCLPATQSISLCASLPACLPFWLSACQSVDPSVRGFVCLLTCLPACLYVPLSEPHAKYWGRGVSRGKGVEGGCLDLLRETCLMQYYLA
jgi:hypothetical protein